MKNKCSNKIALSSGNDLLWKGAFASAHTLWHQTMSKCRALAKNEHDQQHGLHRINRKKSMLNVFPRARARQTNSRISIQYCRFIFIRLAFFRCASDCCCYRCRSRLRLYVFLIDDVFFFFFVCSFLLVPSISSCRLLFRFLLSFSISCYDPHCISKWNESEKWSDKNFHRIPRNRWISLEN